MRIPCERLVWVSLAVVACLAPGADAYIHFPPMTLPKMSKVSQHIRVLKVVKHSKEKGVILFEVEDSLKGSKPPITSFKHVIRGETGGTEPVLRWVADGKTAVMFTIESPVLGVGYVFIDGYCYSVDYNVRGKYWHLIRGEPGMAACYHGSVERLREAVKDILAGKEVKAPAKPPDSKDDPDKRRAEVNAVLKKNRAGGR